MALIRNWGIGLRGDWRTVTGKYNAELRYTLFRLAPIRILGGASLGLGGDNLLDGRLGAFVAIRTVLGLPYVSAQLGVFRSPGDGGVSSAGFVFGGVAF